MKQCGANGYLTVAGKPCQQYLKGKEEACLWHSRSAEERSLLASRGTIAAKLKAALPESFVVPEELTRPATRKLIRDLVEWTLKKSSVDYKRVEVVKGLLGLVATLEQADETARLADAVLAS